MKVGKYIKEARGEMRHVSWPTRRQTLVYTSGVIGFSLLVALLLSLFDLLFNWVLKLTL